MGELQPTHILMVLLVALLLFGGSRVSQLGKGLGEAVRDFKKGLRDDDRRDATGEQKN
jgi:sec-independent protein translocase protein TatA